MTQSAQEHALAEAIAATREITITSATERDVAAVMLKTLRDRANQWKRIRDDEVKPLRAIARAKHDSWKLALQIFARAIDQHSRAIARFELTKRAEAERALADASPAEVARAAELMTPRPKGMQVRTHYAAAVLDPKLVPRELCMPDIPKLNAEARRAKDSFNVPGCELLKSTKAV